MLAHASNRSKLYNGEAVLLAEAFRRFEVTADEAFEAFWQAYSDPYVSQGKVEFRHLWKYIEQRRGGPEKLFTWTEMWIEISKSRNAITQDNFECLNDSDNPKHKDREGKPKWRLK